MARYYFVFGVDGYVGVEVEENNLKSAHLQAESELSDMLSGEDFPIGDIEARLCTVEEDGEIIYDYGYGDENVVEVLG